MKKRLLTGLTAFCLCTAPSLYADEITDILNQIRQSYEAKDYKAALDDLNYISAKIQKLAAAQNQQLLPKPLDGWQMQLKDDGSQMAISMTGGGTMTQAEYSRGKELITIQIIANSPMVSMLAMAINNPMLMQSDPGSEPFRYKRLKGVKKKEGPNTEITLIMAGQILIQLKGENLKDESILKQYLDTMDMKKIKSELLQ
ncbi:hypothetical protein ACM66Z_07830 [Sulfurovum sp. ST-21]|uniref:DUF3887 domain-containing protein n=1 Tax=Sulfurovum indicum TaxID=2779528 RepID=A0A7M1S2B0_9BACT|nr:hypothetical protein [Sulfurovum indicum]QOR61354.1 hypothetical protein IMZ28_07825 [Sulfurovum indicum]